MWDCANHCCRREKRPPAGICPICDQPATFPRDVAAFIASQVIDELRSSCSRIDIAGSIRRRRRRVRDIEIVCEPLVRGGVGQMNLFGGEPEVHQTKLDIVLSTLIKAGRLSRDTRKADGPRYKRLNVSTHEIPLDLFIVRPPATWGVILAIRTGPAEFSKELVATLPEGLKIAGGQLLDRNGDAFWTDDERDLFREIGIPFIPPYKREAGIIQNYRRLQRRREQGER